MSNASDRSITRSVGIQVTEAIDELSLSNPILAEKIGRLVIVLASESGKSRRLANSLTAALIDPTSSSRAGAEIRNSPRATRRRVGPWDPFTIYQQEGEEELRRRLTNLELEQLRDIIAEHGMDTDRLAMKWKDRDRVIDRIVNRVIDRAAKGDAFR